MTTLDVPRYLQRLQLSAAPSATLAGLAELQQRHNAHVPFETLTCLLRDAVPIDLDSVQRKLLHAQRGGYCFELNGAFLALLQALGFDAHPLSARVLLSAGDGELTPRTHLLIRVRLDDEDWLVDTGFGSLTPTVPLRLRETAVQDTPHEHYRLQRLDNGDFLLAASSGDDWRSQYRFDLASPAAADNEVGNWYVCTHPHSSFPGELRASLTGPDWRRTIGSGNYTEYRHGQTPQKRALRDVADARQVLQDRFGVRLPDDARLDPAIAGWLQRWQSAAS
ncbi:arylamine N-acetyltransferase [Stenotrophomonas sp. S48]|uniref:arylamine N-acetyltransferase family protein n=1 Tax=unclassified Stenotrophomonas TaxID=196198 RepID=UPI0019024061|nr:MULTISPECIES: arylamine N-acetyltransferase [unclassified Stenotrophomonas]MBK0026604.1 arylamine N-acetyltransferase [Stenotrophomonas sp. S48]MBK0047019.1 arylamine N-acetyltransferase [Stenotrophomonas sp. S49]